MSGEAFLFLSVVYWGGVAYILLTHPHDLGFWTLVGCLPVYFWLYKTWRDHPGTAQAKRRQADNESKRQQSQRDREVERAAKNRAKEWKSNKPSIPTPDQFGTNVLQAYLKQATKPLRSEYLAQIIKVQTTIFEQAKFDQTKFTPTQVNETIALILRCCVDGLLALTKTIHPALLATPAPTTVFTVPITHSECIGQFVATKDRDFYFEFASGQRAAFHSLGEPFTKNKHLLMEVFNYDSFFPKQHFTDSDNYSDKADYRAALKRNEAWNQELLDLNDEVDKSFWLTPYWRHAHALLPGTFHLAPFELPDEARFRHQWIVGAPGAGKTTFISAMIADDLKKVARNEASIFVMDSQNELIPDIANLEVFAPGGSLHGRLIYLEPDPDYPLALNIFDTNKSRLQTLSSKDRAMLESGAIWMVEFFLSSLVKSDASPHQDTFLNYVIPALMAIPDATIFTFKDLLEGAKVKGGPTGYDRYKQHFIKLRPDTQQWLAERMHSTELSPTRNAIRTRLDGFTARGFFHDMFMHPRNKLDLFDELQTGKVILINTMKGLLKNGTEPFGRYFIARLLQAAEERMFLARGERLPVYCYIDEASDYISEEENIEELLNKARKQKIALVIANQMESQITSPVVRDALSRAAIQCRGQPGDRGEPPHWEIAIGNKEPVAVQVPNVQFSELAKMSKPHFDEMLAYMRRRFSSQPGEYEQPDFRGHQQQEPPKQERPSGPPKDHEYDDRYDQMDKLPLHPLKARTGTVMTVKCPNSRTHQENIPAGTKNGYRFCVKGAGTIRRPDNCNGNFWVELEIPEMSSSEQQSDETDAKPW